MSKDKSIASYKIVADSGGNRYKFYCDVSGALVCTTEPYISNTPEEALQLTWESEGRKHFNPCHKCGKLASDAMFNVEVLECIECFPFESEAKFCKNCGAKIDDPTKPCPQCGRDLLYHGKEIRYEPD